MPWNVADAIRKLQESAKPKYGIGKCATFVREAIEAGFDGKKMPRSGPGDAQHYGIRLLAINFLPVKTVKKFERGDVALIPGFSMPEEDRNKRPKDRRIKKDHLEGHLAMFDGIHWISDFVQDSTTSPYPGSDYEKMNPGFTIYRYSSIGESE